MRGYQIGKGLEKPFEKALENFKVGTATPGVAANAATRIPVQGDPPVNAKLASVPRAVLPDLAKIEVPVVGAETLAKMGQEAKDRKAWAEGAGAKLAQIRERIAKLESDPEARFSPAAQQAIGQLKAAEQQLIAAMASDPALQEHVEFTRLLEEVRAIQPDHAGEVRAVLTKVCQIGRYRPATPAEVDEGRKGKWPGGTLFFEGRVYYSVHEGQQASAGQRALEAELRKLVDSAKLSKASAMKSRGNSDLTGLTCERPRPAMYYLYSPKRTEEARITEGGLRIPERKFSEGHLLVELVDKNKSRNDRPPYLVVEIKAGEGSLRGLADRSNGRTDIPYYWLERGFVIPPKDKETGKPRRLGDDEFSRALKIIKTIRAICAVSGKPFPEQKKPEAKPAETPAPAPALVPTAEQAAEKLVDAVLPSSTKGQAPVPEKKKDRKVKK